MQIMNATTCQQFKMTTTFYVWAQVDETTRRFCGCVEAMGPWGAVTAAQERFGLHAHYAVKASKYGKAVVKTW